MDRGNKENRRNSEATFTGTMGNNLREELPPTETRYHAADDRYGGRALFKFHAFKTQLRQKSLSEMDGRSREYNHRGLAGETEPPTSSGGRKRRAHAQRGRRPDAKGDALFTVMKA